ncbi:MAG: hypothetical protein ABIB93_02315, partial [Chloroflexota bacterium]
EPDVDIARQDGKLVVTSDNDNEHYHFECAFPLLITVTKDVNTPRLPTFRDKLRARGAKVEVWHAGQLAASADINRFGSAGSATRVLKITVPAEEGRKGRIFREDISEATTEILKVLSGKMEA